MTARSSPDPLARIAAGLVVGGVVWLVSRRVLPGTTPAFVAAAAGTIVHELLDAPVAAAFAQAGL